MNIIYHWIGFAVVWLSVIICTIIVLWTLFKIIMDELGRNFKSLWIFVEFAVYRKDFKEWVKNKQRHKNLQ